MSEAWLRDEVPTLRDRTYLNTCSLCALHDRVRGAVEEQLDDWQALGARAWYDRWLDQLEATRARFARIVGAHEDEVALLPNVSSALSIVSSGLDVNGRNEVVLTDMDFPTTTYPFLVREDVRVRMVESPDGVHVPPEAIEAELGPDTAALSTSHVFFTSGALQDVQRLCRAADEVGAVSIIDAYQATGQVPTDVHALGCDVLVTGGLKWLLGGTGIAYLYVSREAQASLEPSLAGWFGDAEQFGFDATRFSPRKDARRYEMGTPSIPSVCAGRAGLELVEELGPKRIRERETELVTDLYERFEDAGFELATPEQPEKRAGIVMVKLKQPGDVVERLFERGIIVDHRPGRLRASPYVYNTLEENAELVEAVVEIVG